MTLQGNFSHKWPIWERVIGLIASGIWPPDEWQSAFEAMHSGRIVKAVLQP